MHRQFKYKKSKEPKYDILQGLLSVKMINIMKMQDNMNHLLGKQVEYSGAVLTVNTRSFLEIVNSNLKEDNKNLIVQMNKILNQIIPVILQSNGIIDRFNGDGLSAIYTKNSEDAIKAAIEISEIMKVSIGISYGEIISGILGNESAFNTVTISQYTGLSEYLQLIAKSYYSKTLISQTFVNQVKDFYNQYENRFLGYLYMKSSDRLEKIYDLFIVDNAETRWIKKKTKIIFEQGVNLFAHSNYDMARKHFIEVLKVNRNDSAARKYLYLCENYLEHNSKGDIYFESC